MSQVSCRYKRTRCNKPLARYWPYRQPISVLSFVDLLSAFTFTSDLNSKPWTQPGRQRLRETFVPL